VASHRRSKMSSTKSAARVAEPRPPLRRQGRAPGPASTPKRPHHSGRDRCDYPSPPEMVLARPERVNQKAKPSLTGLLLSRCGGRPISHRHRSHVPNSKIAREINPPTSSERNDPSANNPIHPARQCADSRIRTLQPLARAGLGRPSFGGTGAACSEIENRATKPPKVPMMMRIVSRSCFSTVEQ
jgi:hypothetical protein